MTKRLNFLEIIEEEFKWPRPEDRPFVDSVDGAKLSRDEYSRLVLMTAGYKIGADGMVSTALTDKRVGEQLVYSIVFNYRHFLELSLKRLIEAFGPYAGVDPEWRTHNLEELWTQFQRIIDHFVVPDQDEADALVQGVVQDFAQADPGSFYYRYPYNRDGTAAPLTLENIDLDRLRDTMERVSNYFEACEEYWSTKVPVSFVDAESPTPEIVG